MTMARMAAYVLAALSTACAGDPDPDGEADSGTQAPEFELVRASEVEWDLLNPARGDASPRAGTLWGDRHRPVPTGFLFNPIDGFESPPHIHNVTYRGVVIRGAVHNAHPSNEPMWMPPGSFWTQPRGAVHITAAKGEDVLAYIEIDQGPYLVMPPEDQEDFGKVAINVHESNLVWVEPRSPDAPDGVYLAHLWDGHGTSGERGSLVRLAAGLEVTIHDEHSTLRAVVIEGDPHYRSEEQETDTPLSPGAYFRSSPGAAQTLRSPTGEVILYVRSVGEPLVRSAG